MKPLTFVIGLAATLIITSPANGQDSIADKVKAIQKEYQEAGAAYTTAMRAAKTTAERAAAAKENKMPDRAKFAARYMEAVEKTPADPAAAEALVSAFTLDYRGATGPKALELLTQHHLASPRVTSVLPLLPSADRAAAEKFARALVQKTTDESVKRPAMLALGKVLKPTNPDEADKVFQTVLDTYGAKSAEAAVSVATADYRGSVGAKALAVITEHHLKSPQLTSLMTYLPHMDGAAAEKFARLLAEKSEDRTMQAQATMALAKMLKNSKPAESRRALQTVVDRYADVTVGATKALLADQAKKDLKQMETFGVGQVVPEIAGNDIDGKAFKLSDYRGKVVMIDFWGDW